MIGQMMWLTFSLIRNEATPVLGLAPGDATIVLLTISQPLAFIIFSIPIGMLADRKGLIDVAGTGAIIQTIFGALRIFVINDFWLIFLCQFGLSIGAVMVQNCITYLSVKWFPRSERVLATGVGTLFMLLGMLFGSALSLLLWTAPIYGDPAYTVSLAQDSIEFILNLDTVLAVILTILFFAIARNKPPHPPDIEAPVTKKRTMSTMIRDKNVWIVSYGFFAGFGAFIGLTAILEELLPSLGIPITAGFGSAVIVQVLLLSFGIAGALILSGISDKVQRRKPFLIIAILIGSITTFVVGTSSIPELTYVASAILGFFLISVMPIALSTLEEFESVGPELSGASAGLAFWFGNLGAILVSLLLETLRVGTSYFYSIVFLFIVMLIATGLILIIPETGRREPSKD